MRFDLWCAEHNIYYGTSTYLILERRLKDIYGKTTLEYGRPIDFENAYYDCFDSKIVFRRSRNYIKRRQEIKHHEEKVSYTCGGCGTLVIISDTNNTSCPQLWGT